MSPPMRCRNTAMAFNLSPTPHKRVTLYYSTSRRRCSQYGKTPVYSEKTGFWIRTAYFSVRYWYSFITGIEEARCILVNAMPR